MSTRLAVIQEPPALLDLETSLKRAIAHLEKAAGEGARLVVFPETYLPGYPAWLWRLRPGSDMGLIAEIHGRLLENSVDLATSDLDEFRATAAREGTTVVLGLHERDSTYSRSTIFNTVVVIGRDGRILNRHRKLVPTNPERMLWGRGDARGLRVVDTPEGRLGVLICWENYMPLARYALYSEGVEIYVAPTWDSGEGWLASLSHIAKEGGCWVVGCGTALQAKDVPRDFPSREDVFPDEEEWLCPGDSVVFRPFGAREAGPLRKDRGILYAELDASRAAAARRSLDVAGHYSRPDVFRLEVDRSASRPVEFRDEGPPDVPEPAASD